MATYKLYSRPDCHLCDEALQLIEVSAPGLSPEVVDIEGDLDLIRRYGFRVPVLHDTAGERELDWPFDATGLQNFLQNP